MIQRTRNKSIMLSLPSNQSANHAILTFQPTPSIPLLQQYIISAPYLDAYSSICFPAMARIRKILPFLFFVLLFLRGSLATRGEESLPTLTTRRAALVPHRMPVPPSGPSKGTNYVPKKGEPDFATHLHLNKEDKGKRNPAEPPR
jgi:hypothetical protein